ACPAWARGARTAASTWCWSRCTRASPRRRCWARTASIRTPRATSSWRTTGTPRSARSCPRRDRSVPNPAGWEFHAVAMSCPTLKRFLPWAALVFVLALALPAGAATLYVSPTGTATTGCTTRANPCSLASAATAAVAGDVVVLMDGVYKQQPLLPQNSGTASAWITFQADECATPIIEGQGQPPDMSVDDDVGVYSSTAEYVRFVGLVSRGWNEGFGNGWGGGTDSTPRSHGNRE